MGLHFQSRMDMEDDKVLDRAGEVEDVSSDHQPFRLFQNFIKHTI